MIASHPWLLVLVVVLAFGGRELGKRSYRLARCPACGYGGVRFLYRRTGLLVGVALLAIAIAAHGAWALLAIPGCLLVWRVNEEGRHYCRACRWGAPADTTAAVPTDTGG